MGYRWGEDLQPLDYNQNETGFPTTLLQALIEIHNGIQNWSYG